MDERGLAQRLQRGDRLALERAMDRYTAYLSTVVWRTMGPSATAQDVEEVISDAFLALWQHRTALNPEQGIKAYLATIARNRAADRLRAMGPSLLPLEDQTAALSPGPEKAMEQRMFAHALRQAVDGLPETDRVLVDGYYYEGQKLKDLARRLGLSVPAAKTRLCRARKALKQMLTKGGTVYGADEQTLAGDGTK